MKKITFTMLSLCAALWAEAGGFQVLLQGVRQTGMGNTGSALADVSNAFYNPGAVGFIEGSGIAVGGNAVFAESRFAPSTGGQTYKTDNPISPPFYLHAAFGFGKDKRIKALLSVVTPYGSTVKWEDGWVGKTNLTQIELRAIYIQPGLAYRVNDKLSLGAGFQYMLGSVNLERQAALPINGLFADSQLKGSANGIGWNVGFVYKPNDFFRIGGAYRSRIDAKVEDGTATFSNIPTLGGPVGAQIATNFPNLVNGTATTKFTSTLPLPAVATLGLSWTPNENITINIDARYSFWSDYKQLAFTFADPVAGSTTSVSPRNYRDAIAVGAGIEYKIKNVRLRTGAYYDGTPVQDAYVTAETPDARTIYFTGGLGFALGQKVNLDLSLLYGAKENRSNLSPALDNTGVQIAPAGNYRTTVIVPSLGVSFKF